MKPTQIHTADFMVTTWHHSPDGPLEDLLVPEYWAHVAERLRPGHKIEVLSESGDYWAMLIVRDAGRLQAKVAVLQYVPLLSEQIEVSPDYEVKWRGPARKFSVVRKSDAGVLRDGFDDRDVADAWLKDHLR